ncbi:MAG: serine hydrolase [Myxococcota bacterium]
MNRLLATVLVGALVGLLAGGAGAYPLDGYKRTGIARLYAFKQVEKSLVSKGQLKPGATLSTRKVKLRLLDQPELELPKPDPELSKRIRELLGADAAAYGVGILDLSDPDRPRYGEVNGLKAQQPGSVGKIMVLVAFFQALADAFPDTGDRERILRETVITANELIRRDTHNVPIYAVGDPRVERRPIREGEQANLWTYLDWMVSASSNAAASMVIAQVLLLKKFGASYPVSSGKADDYLRKTSRGELSRALANALVPPLKRSGINPAHLQQGSFFTREGRSRAASAGSTATARELVRYCLRMEQGKLVDRWSSLEIKRLLYLTDIRIRYASSPALDSSAVYFKSGSLYECKPEKGFECRKFHGNVRNYMNSVTLVETSGRRSLHYVAAVLSNVLRKDSKGMHVSLAGEIHRMMQASRR